MLNDGVFFFCPSKKSLFCGLFDRNKQEGYEVNFHIGETEKRLTERLHSGDHAAMQEMYALFGGQMMATIMRYVGNEEDAKDVLQDTLIKVFSRIDDFTYRGPGSLRAWMMRVAVNQSLSHLRERQRNGYVDLERDVPDIIDEPEPDVGDVPPEVIQGFIERLPDGYRAVFMLYVFEGWPHDRIAQHLGIKRDTSASQFHRAKALLAKQITEYRRVKETEK